MTLTTTVQLQQHESSLRDEDAEEPQQDPNLPVQFDACQHLRGTYQFEERPTPLFYRAGMSVVLVTLMIFGSLRDLFGLLFKCSRFHKYRRKGYAPLLSDWDAFYTRRFYFRIRDCWNRPISSAPAAGSTRVMTRKAASDGVTLVPDGGSVECINMSSYNYLGFADDWHTTCKSHVVPVMDTFSSALSVSVMDGGKTPLHTQLEKKVAEFVNKPAALCFSMGYLTNEATIPALVGKGGLIVSDAYNHKSIVNGARASGAAIRPFTHNNPEALDKVLAKALKEGQPGSGRPWTKILVVVEGIYSMEGDICRLKEIVTVAKRYKCYMYLDEAHSIGCLGETGRGVCEYTGVDTADIDIMMGTFTKSFGAMGGYIAGSQELVSYLRTHANGSVYGAAMSPVVVAQTLRALQVIMGEDGTDTGARKLAAIRNNANYFRARLMDLGCYVLGDVDSPVVPMILYSGPKISSFSREALKRGLAVVVVGYPVTDFYLARVRFCISAAHTKAQLDRTLEVVDELADRLMLRYTRSGIGL